MKFFNNDTIALCFLGLIAIFGVIMKMESVVSVALGAIGGYIGNNVINKDI